MAPERFHSAVKPLTVHVGGKTFPDLTCCNSGVPLQYRGPGMSYSFTDVFKGSLHT